MRLAPPLALLALLAPSACRAPAPDDPPAATAPLDFAAAGCLLTSPPGGCALAASSTLALWLPLSPHDALTVGGGQLVDRRSRGRGQLVHVRPDAERGALRITARTATRTAELRLTLTTATATTPASDALAAGRRALRSGDSATALDRLREAEAGPPLLARRAAMLGAWVAAVTVGDPVEAERRLGRSTSTGPRGEDLDRLDGEGAALAAYHRGLLSAMQGDRRGALEALERAGRLAEQLDLPLLDTVRQLEALQLVEIGRADEAVQLLEGLVAVAGALPPRARADLLNNLAAARTVAGQPPARARLELRQALDDYQASEAVMEANNARASLALLELEDGQPEAARDQLAQIAGPVLPVTAAWQRLLQARVDEPTRPRSRACTAYARLAADARQAQWGAIEARAELGVGRCYEAAGRPAEARAAYQRAAAALDDEGAKIPLDRGTLERMDGRAEVEAHLLRGEIFDDGWDAVRRRRLQDLERVARARAPGAPGSPQREQWLARLAAYRAARSALDAAALDAWQSTTAEAPARQAELQRLGVEVRHQLRALLGTSSAAPAAPPPLPALAPGELRLVATQAAGHPLILGRTDQGGWTWSPGRGGSGPTGRPALPVIAAAAATVTVIGERTPELAQLIGDRPWAHTTDLGPAPREVASPQRALVVADPRGDLPQARREGDEVSALLRAHGWTVELRTGAAATRAAVEAGLAEVALLHYAGHGRDLDDRRWDGALLLADGQLEVADVVASATVPRWVVLSGCQTAVIGRGDLTLAQAFVVAGAQAVVATATVVDDALARGFAQRLYGGPAERWALDQVYPAARGSDDVFRLVVR